MNATECTNFPSHFIQTIKCLKKWIDNCIYDPPPQSKIPKFQIELKDHENVSIQEVIIYGYDDTPYGGGKFLLEFIFPIGYPFKPPEIYFKTKIYHLNVDEDGKIKNVFNDQWSPAIDIRQTILIIHAMLADPITYECCIATHVEEVYFSDKRKYREIAAEWTRKYAFN